jgi:hypothetical protein
MTSDSTRDGVARLDVSRAFHADPEPLCRALADPSWLGQVVDSPPDRPDLTRVETDLAFTLQAEAGRQLVFRKAALVDIGIGAATRDGCQGEIGWRAASFSPLFPVFAGRLVVGRSRIQIQGVYAPPGGQLGLLIDRAMIHRFAERTARWFLDQLVVEMRRVEQPPGSAETA